MEAIERVTTMTINLLGRRVFGDHSLPTTLRASMNHRGQALVEFIGCFILLLIVAWIPADFGLAFYSGQLASNAAREGARIGSVTVGSGTVVVSGVTYPTLNSTNFSDIATETCRRLPSALLGAPSGSGWTSCGSWSNAQVKAELVAGTGTCNQMVQVTVGGTYNYFFYRLLAWLGVPVGNLNTNQITRVALMRWEHQNC